MHGVILVEIASRCLQRHRTASVAGRPEGPPAELPVSAGRAEGRGRCRGALSKNHARHKGGRTRQGLGSARAAAASANIEEKRHEHDAVGHSPHVGCPGPAKDFKTAGVHLRHAVRHDRGQLHRPGQPVGLRGTGLARVRAVAGRTRLAAVRLSVALHHLPGPGRIAGGLAGLPAASAGPRSGSGRCARSPPPSSKARSRST